MNAVVYDENLKDFPISDLGVQLVDLGRMLYPGGPWAMRVTTAMFPVFYAGWRVVRDDDVARMGTGRISHIGGRLAGEKDSRVAFSASDLIQVKVLIEHYVARHGLFGREVAGLEFVDEDQVVEIF